MRFNWKKLYLLLNDARLADGGESWRFLARKLQVTPSLFTRISQGKPTSVQNLLKLMAFLPQVGILDLVVDINYQQALKRAQKLKGKR